MSKQSPRSKHAILDKQPQKPSNNYFIFSNNLKKVHPINNGLHKTCSVLSLSSLSLSLSQTSNDSSLTDSSLSPLDQNISLALALIASPEKRGSRPPATRNARRQRCISPGRNIPSPSSSEDEVKRCNWITKNSDNVYMKFHDECWGVPVYDDK
nr:DNA-3-methyladenine glycosylase-like [Ipomoea batatas]